MASDRLRLRKRLRGLGRGRGEKQQQALVEIEAAIAASAQRYQQRQQHLPAITYPEELPVSERREEILAAIQQHQVVVLAGETGSGKTTQLPKICLEAGRGIAGMIGHTQPRRIAARSVAARIAEELNTPLGEAVGYKVRFSHHSHTDAYIKLMTDGILLAELQHDRLLSQYDTLIIDEAHERSLNIDFLLGYLKHLLPRRPDLKLIITSATIDTERFSRHFGDAPIIEVSGRTYPVEIRYRPLGGEDLEEDVDMVSGILAAVDELAQTEGRGDTLVFLSGEREIRDTAEALRKHHPPHTEILPLYSRLSTSEQNRVFQSSRGRRIVLATNVAETSLTVPGIRFVVDPGTARISRYSYRSKVQRLPIERVSQSSANQRAGRCGRVSAGVCVRLYSEEDFNARPAFTEPEIQRTNLAAVILQMRELGLGDPLEFPFIDPPDSRFVNDGYRLLQELGAMDEQRQLTQLGRRLARLPIDPRIGRMILAAQDKSCLNEVLVIASALSVQDPRERPADKQQQADEKHRRYRDEDSDFVALLNLWRASREQQKHLSNNQWRKYCKQNFLAFMRMKEWAETHQQLRTLVKGMGMKPNQTAADYDAIHQSLLTGLLGNIGQRAEPPQKDRGAKKQRRELQRYLGARNTAFAIFPGSGLAKKAPRWLMAAELVETSRLFARQNARIEPAWIEEAALHLVKRQYSEPQWDEKRGQVSAFESVSLYGLVLQARRRVRYGPINPEEAREIFIREGLVHGRLRTRAAFFAHNQALIAEARAIEDKLRRRDVVVDEDQLYTFFDRLIPAQINNSISFERWRKKAEAKEPRLLMLCREDVMAQSTGSKQPDYPGEISVNGVILPLSYCFNPGGDDDGVTATIPVGALNQLDAAAFEWGVPGLLEEKIATLLKSLPKALRKQLVPIPQHAEALSKTLLRHADERPQGLLAAMAQQLAVQHQLQIGPSDWRLEQLPPHLLMRFRIVDEQQKTLAVGRDLGELQAQYGGQATQAQDVISAEQAWPTQGITSWDFGDLPPYIVVERGGSRYRAYPALVDKQDSVGVSLLDSVQSAQQTHAAGLQRLLILSLGRDSKYLRRNLPQIDTMCLHYATLGNCDELKDQLLRTVIAACFFAEGYEVRSKQAFEQRLAAHRSGLMEMANDTCRLVAEILALFHELFHELHSGDWKKGARLPESIRADIQAQLQGLVHRDFLDDTPQAWLPHLPRFLRAIKMRLGKLAMVPTADDDKMQRLSPFLLQYKNLNGQAQVDAAQLKTLRWMLEEYRVSLFAQTLKTSMPISPKRIEKQIHRCEKGR